MSCPDWTALTSHRRHGGREPEGWSAAAAHFDRGCQTCRKAALKADPTLVFRRLAQVPAAAMTEAQERAEIDSVRRAVAAMRTASRLDKGSRGLLPTGGWKRWSAAAALALVAVTVPSDDARRPARPAKAPAGEILDLPGQAVRQSGAATVLEGGVDLPGARVYHLGDRELSVVMVFDESFDESFGS